MKKRRAMEEGETLKNSIARSKKKKDNRNSKEKRPGDDEIVYGD